MGYKATIVFGLSLIEVPKLGHPDGIVGLVALIALVSKLPEVVSALPSSVTPVFKFIAPLLQIIVPLNLEFYFILL